MKKINLFISIAFAAIIINNAFAEPFGFLICSLSVNASNQQVLAINVSNGATQLLTKTDELWTAYDGVGNHITKLFFDDTFFNG